MARNKWESMGNLSKEAQVQQLVIDLECQEITITWLKQCYSLLSDLHARMVDVYDGSPDSTNHLPFTGGDIRDIEEVLR